MSGCKGSSIGQREKDTEAVIIKVPDDAMGKCRNGMVFQNYPELRGGKPDFYILSSTTRWIWATPWKGE